MRIEILVEGVTLDLLWFWLKEDFFPGNWNERERTAEKEGFAEVRLSAPRTAGAWCGTVRMFRRWDNPYTALFLFFAETTLDGFFYLDQRWPDKVHLHGGSLNESEPVKTLFDALEAWLSAHYNPQRLPAQIAASPSLVQAMQQFGQEKNWDRLFDWYHQASRQECPDLRTLAEMIGYAYQYVSQKHSLYRKRRGL